MARNNSQNAWIGWEAYSLQPVATISGDDSRSKVERLEKQLREQQERNAILHTELSEVKRQADRQAREIDQLRHEVAVYKTKADDTSKLHAEVQYLTKEITRVEDHYLELRSAAKSARLPPKLGIDLGNFNCCVSYVIDDAVERVQNEYGQQVFNSGLRITSLKLRNLPDPIEFGIVPTGPSDIGCLKRLVGMDLNEFLNSQEELQFQLTCQALKAGDNSVVFEFPNFENGPLNAEMLMALEMMQIRAISKRSLNSRHEIDGACFVIPSYYGNQQRLALVEAAKIAGFNTVKLLGETQAAFEQYRQLADGQLPKSVVFVSMGANHMEVSLFEMRKSGKSHDLICSASSPFGSSHIDCLLLQHVTKLLGAVEPDRLMLLEECRRAKETFSQGLKRIQMKSSTKTLQITIEEYEQYILPNVVSKLKPLIEELPLKCQPQSIVVCGNAMRIPSLQKYLSQLLSGVPIAKQLLYPEAIADGAAWYIATSSQEKRLLAIKLDVEFEQSFCSNAYRKTYYVTVQCPGQTQVSIASQLRDVTAITVKQQRQVIARCNLNQNSRLDVLTLETDDHGIVISMHLGNDHNFHMATFHGISDLLRQKTIQFLKQYEEEVNYRRDQNELIDRLDGLLTICRVEQTKHPAIEKRLVEWERWRLANKDSDCSAIKSQIDEITSIMNRNGIVA